MEHVCYYTQLVSGLVGDLNIYIFVASTLSLHMSNLLDECELR